MTTIAMWFLFGTGFALGTCVGATLDMIWWLSRERRARRLHVGDWVSRKKARPF